MGRVAGELRQLAAALEAAGQHGEALSVLGRVADMDATDIEARVQLVRAHIGNGDLGTARRYLTRRGRSRPIPRCGWWWPKPNCAQGHLDEGKAAVASALAADPPQREAAIAMACRLAEHDADSAYPGIEAVADAAVADGDFAAAAAALHEFVTRVRRHIVALMRLVEICVDGGLEATMYSAQAQLADAYLDAGRGLEARIISEDLVAREPWDSANIARFRRALEMLGESDPDAIIADRLSGDSPFLATDKMDLNEGITFDDPVETARSRAARPTAIRRPTWRGVRGAEDRQGRARARRPRVPLTPSSRPVAPRTRAWPPNSCASVSPTVTWA